jgi:hypothetical protein
VSVRKRSITLSTFEEEKENADINIDDEIEMKEKML